MGKKLLTSEFILKNKVDYKNCEKCIYFLIENNEIVFVGKSEKGIGRIFQHVDKKFDSYYVFSDFKGNINDVEAHFIIKFNPKYNRTVPTNEIYKSIKIFKKYNLNLWDIKKIIKQYNIPTYFGGAYVIQQQFEAALNEWRKEGDIDE